jgi:hypothetical protein
MSLLNVVENSRIEDFSRNGLFLIEFVKYLSKFMASVDFYHTIYTDIVLWVRTIYKI